MTMLGDDETVDSSTSSVEVTRNVPVAVSGLYGSQRRSKLRVALIWIGAGAAALGLGLIAGMAHGATL